MDMRVLFVYGLIVYTFIVVSNHAKPGNNVEETNRWKQGNMMNGWGALDGQMDSWVDGLDDDGLVDG